MATIQDVRAVNSPQKAYMWEVEVRGLATGGLDDMSVFAKTVSVPASSVDQIIINHKAGKAHHAGRDSAGHTATITFWDDENLSVYKFLTEWKYLLSNPITHSGVSRDLYSADLVIRLKDSSDDNVTGEFVLSAAWPTEVSEVSLNYDSSEAIEVSATFSYDVKVLS